MPSVCLFGLFADTGVVQSCSAFPVLPSREAGELCLPLFNQQESREGCRGGCAGGSTGSTVQAGKGCGLPCATATTCSIPYLSQTRVLRCRDVEQGEGGRGRESRIADPKCGGPLRVIWEALIPQGCLFQQQLWQQSRVWG